jgi:hypothetical protein
MQDQRPKSTKQSLPDKIDTKKVVEMIRNADLYDLINISLKQNEVNNEQVEMFIQRALEGLQNEPSKLHLYPIRENDEPSETLPRFNGGHSPVKPPKENS